MILSTSQNIKNKKALKDILRSPHKNVFQCFLCFFSKVLAEQFLIIAFIKY